MGISKMIVSTVINFPARCFSKISPFALIRNSKISRKSAILSATRFYSSSVDDYSYIGRNCFINKTSIGKFCSIADNCNIGLATHPISWVSTSPSFHKGKNNLRVNFANHDFVTTKETVIEHDVWIGINVNIVAGVTIKTGAIIGAGAVVTKDVESYTIVGGNPAKVIRKRFADELTVKLLRSKWWEMDEEKIYSMAQYFPNPDQFLEMIGG